MVVWCRSMVVWRSSNIDCGLAQRLCGIAQCLARLPAARQIPHSSSGRTFRLATAMRRRRLREVLRMCIPIEESHHERKKITTKIFFSSSNSSSIIAQKLSRFDVFCLYLIIYSKPLLFLTLFHRFIYALQGNPIYVFLSGNSAASVPISTFMCL